MQMWIGVKKNSLCSMFLEAMRRMQLTADVKPLESRMEKEYTYTQRRFNREVAYSP